MRILYARIPHAEIIGMRQPEDNRRLPTSRVAASLQLHRPGHGVTMANADASAEEGGQ